MNKAPIPGRRFHDAKPQARRAGEERQELDGAHGREPPVEAAPGCAPASLNTLSRAAAAARAAAGGVWRGGGVAPAAAPSPRTARDHTNNARRATTPPPRESPSNHRRAVAATTSVRESAVPHVLTPRAHAAYDGWIQELCADAEEAAAERDRLKAKLAKLKEEHKRKMMIKILSRMSNMTYYQAWSAWYNGTIKINQLSADEELKMLLREVAAAKEQAEKLEAEAQARADEAAAQAMGAATDKQRNLCKKIFTRMIQGKTRVFWQHWDMQTFGKKRMQAVMKKVLKRLLKGQLHKGYQQWKYVATKWDLVQKIALKDRLIKELEDLERKAKEFEKECESRQEAAMQAALNRATGEQKELLIKILAKMTGNMSVFAFKIWAEKVRKFNESTTLTTKILYRMINMKKSLGFKKWFEVCMGDAQDKFKLKEELLMGQRDQLLAVLRARAEQLEKLQAEAAELLEASQRNAADTSSVMQISTRFADNVMVILDKKALDEELGIDTDNAGAQYADLDI